MGKIAAALTHITPFIRALEACERNNSLYSYVESKDWAFHMWVAMSESWLTCEDAKHFPFSSTAKKYIKLIQFLELEECVFELCIKAMPPTRQLKRSMKKFCMAFENENDTQQIFHARFVLETLYQFLNEIFAEYDKCVNAHIDYESHYC